MIATSSHKDTVKKIDIENDILRLEKKNIS
jgi:hypothetical protein